MMRGVVGCWCASGGGGGGGAGGWTLRFDPHHPPGDLQTPYQTWWAIGFWIWTNREGLAVLVIPVVYRSAGGRRKG